MRSLILAILAVTVATSSGAPFVLGYIASRTALIIGVMYLFVSWFTCFVDGVVRTDFSHLLASCERFEEHPRFGPIS